jgi:hypothetical protein
LVKIISQKKKKKYQQTIQKNNLLITKKNVFHHGINILMPHHGCYERLGLIKISVVLTSTHKYMGQSV